jgi:hypothetical protein
MGRFLADFPPTPCRLPIKQPRGFGQLSGIVPSGTALPRGAKTTEVRIAKIGITKCRKECCRGVQRLPPPPGVHEGTVANCRPTVYEQLPRTRGNGAATSSGIPSPCLLVKPVETGARISFEFRLIDQTAGAAAGTLHVSAL